VLLGGHAEEEVRGEPLGVAFDLLVQPLYSYAVKFGKVRVEYHSVAAKKKYS